MDPANPMEPAAPISPEEPGVPISPGEDLPDMESIPGSSMSEATVDIARRPNLQSIFHGRGISVNYNYYTGDGSQTTGRRGQPQRTGAQSDVGSPVGSLLAPIGALSQTEALRSQAMIRNKLQRSRNNQQNDESILYVAYAPYATVSDSTTENMLLRISDKLHFLDCGFAEYFTSVVESDAVYVRMQLRDIRRRFTEAQNPSCSADALDDNPDLDVNLGDLGHFCEQVLQAHEAAEPFKSPGGPRFHVTCGDVAEKLIYLQDALEVPYWKLMLKHFGIWRANSSGLTGKVILSVIYSAKLELKVAVAELKHQGTARGITENLAPIVKGIESRIEFLDSVRDSSVDGLHMLEDILRRSHFLPGYHVTPMPSMVPQVIIPATGTDTPRTITVVNMVAVICLLVLAIPPFAVGFHKASTRGGVGAFQDADFWFLVQGNIMSTLGSVLMVVPMLRGPWFSLVYTTVYLMLGAGLVCSIVSVAIFTHVHTGWSSAFVLFGSMLSTWAVLIMAQGQGWKREEAEKVEVKVKAD